MDALASQALLCTPLQRTSPLPRNESCIAAHALAVHLTITLNRVMH